MATDTRDKFSVVDYVVFSIMLLISALIGIWYGCGPGGKQKTTAEYLLANRKMRHFPVAISLLVSYLSAITLLGVPSEIYTYGAQYYVLIVSYFIICGTVAVVFVPMFRRVNITCANEYLELRFSVGVRIVGCLFFILEYTLYLFVVLYAPSLALEAVAGIPLSASILTTGIVCTFYTSLGGLKAVIWTDVFQSTIMVAGLIVVVIVGSIEVGGFGEVWRINKKFDRLNFFDFNPDPKVRNTFWTLTLGGAFTAMPVWTVSQTAVQRFLAIRTFKDARRAVWLNVPGLIIIVTLCCLDGLVIFAVYSECDLRVQKLITSNDQTLPFFVIDKLGHLKGLPGMFTACLYAGALSTASSALNAMALVCLEDVVKKKVPDISDSDAAKLCKIIALSFGVIVIGGAFVVKYVGTMVLQLAYSIFGICGGPLLGIFFLGMFVPRANSKGAYFGVFTGAALTTWVFLGSVLYPPNKYPGLRSVEGCDFYKNACAARDNGTYDNATAKVFEEWGDGIIRNSFKGHSEPIADFYSMSYLWFSGLSVLTAFVVGIIMSLILETKEDKERVIDPKLLFPVKEWLLSWLPGHSFKWDFAEEEEAKLRAEELEETMPIHQEEIKINWDETPAVDTSDNPEKDKMGNLYTDNLIETSKL